MMDLTDALEVADVDVGAHADLYADTEGRTEACSQRLRHALSTTLNGPIGAVADFLGL
jgi:hypothetical protein